jgi:hypothetical protein
MEGGNRAAWAMVQILRGEEGRFRMGREGREIIHRFIALIALVVVMCLWRWLFRKERGMVGSKWHIGRKAVTAKGEMDD